MLIARSDRPVQSLPALIQDLEARVEQFAATNKSEIIFPGYEQSFTRMLLSLASLIASVLCWLAFFFWRVLTDSEAIRFGFVGLALLFGLYNRLDDRREKKRVKRYNEGARVGLAANIQFAGALLDPENTKATFGLSIMTTDRELQADGERLAEMANYLFEAKEEGATFPESLKEAVERTREERIDHRRWDPLPREFTGNDQTWLVSVLYYPKTMPRGVIDRTLWPVLYHQDDRDVGVIVPDQELWWSEGVDAFMEHWYDAPEPEPEEATESSEDAVS